MKLWKALSVIIGLASAAYTYANSFDAYQCSGDCSGHQAGYDWAEQNQIDDESSCSTPSNSFNEGCASYVEGGAGIALADDDDDDDDDDDAE
jgi:hypothetical protein